MMDLFFDENRSNIEKFRKMSARPAKSTKRVELNEKPEGLSSNESILSLWRQHPFAFITVAFAVGFVVASYVPSDSLVIGEPELDSNNRHSLSWNSVVGISNHSDVCSKSTCTTWDAIVVLGGGPEDSNGMPVWTKKRLDVFL